MTILFRGTAANVCLLRLTSVILHSAHLSFRKYDDEFHWIDFALQSKIVRSQLPHRCRTTRKAFMREIFDERFHRTYAQSESRGHRSEVLIRTSEAESPPDATRCTTRSARLRSSTDERLF